MACMLENLMLGDYHGNNYFIKFGILFIKSVQKVTVQMGKPEIALG